MSDSRDDHNLARIVDGVHDSVIADTNAVVVTAGELGRSARPRVFRQSVDRLLDAISKRSTEASIRARGLAIEADLVAQRTSTQASVASAFSRALTAARLSSRYSIRSISSA